MENKTLNIALVVDLFYPPVDGVVKTVDQYAREMLKMGHTPVVICPKIKGWKRVKLPYEVYRLPIFKLPLIPFSITIPFLTIKTKKYLKSKHFDIIHMHSPFTAGRMFALYGKLNHIPTIASFHSKYYDDAYNVTHSKLIAKVLTRDIVRFYRFVDYVWACSNATAKTLIQYGYKGNVKAMPNGVEKMPEGNILDFKNEAIKLFNVDTNKNNILFVGQLIWHKHLKLILDVAKQLSLKSDDYNFILAGEGYNQKEIKEYAKSLNLGMHINFVGKIENRRQLFGLYASADLFFFPSLYDNAPLVVRESALAGLPSLLTEGSNSAEIVTDNVNGYLAKDTVEEMTSKIESIFADKKKLKEVGLQAQNTIPIHWDKIVEIVLNEYYKKIQSK